MCAAIDQHETGAAPARDTDSCPIDRRRDAYPDGTEAGGRAGKETKRASRVAWKLRKEKVMKGDLLSYRSSIMMPWREPVMNYDVERTSELLAPFRKVRGALLLRSA